MKYKDHIITLEKVSGWVWVIEKPDGSTIDIEDGASLHDTKSEATEDAKEIIDSILKPQTP